MAHIEVDPTAFFADPLSISKQSVARVVFTLYRGMLCSKQYFLRALHHRVTSNLSNSCLATPTTKRSTAFSLSLAASAEVDASLPVQRGRRIVPNLS